MKSLFVVLCFSFIFPILKTVHGNFGVLRKRLDAYGENINGALKITPQSYLGDGSYAVVYKGFRINDSTPVAVKFIHNSNRKSAEREYILYTYLYAIGNSSVERYGIPCVYYFANWEEFIVMAITLCQKSLEYRQDFFSFPINAMIVFHQFVRQSKYIHKCGIRHDDIKPQNIMLRSYQSFLVDYNLGSKMNYDTHLYTMIYAPRRIHQNPNQNRKAIDDWESFFYGMAEICNVNFEWFSIEGYINLTTEQRNQKYGAAKNDTKEIERIILKLDSEELKSVFMAFFGEIFQQQKDFPRYDLTERNILHQIQRALARLVTPDHPVFFTWLNVTDIGNALEHIRRNPIPNIPTIDDPKKFNFNYPKFNFSRFSDYKAAESSNRIF